MFRWHSLVLSAFVLLGAQLLGARPAQAIASSALHLVDRGGADAVADPFPGMLLAGAGAAAVAVPLGLAAGVWLGGLSNDTVRAVAPPVLLFLALPPLAVTWAEWAWGNHKAPGSYRFVPTALVATGVQLLAITGGILTGVAPVNLTSLALFTLAEVVLLPTSVALSLRFFGPPAAPSLSAPAAEVPHAAALLPDPGLPRAVLLPLVQVGF